MSKKCRIKATLKKLWGIGIDDDISGKSGKIIKEYPTGFCEVEVEGFTYTFDIPKSFLKMENEAPHTSYHTINNPVELSFSGFSGKITSNKPIKDKERLVSFEWALELRTALGKLVDNGYQVPTKELLEETFEIYKNSLKY